MMVKSSRCATLALAMACALPLVSLGQDSVVTHTPAATTYLNGGIGDTEEATMRSLGKQFSLRMIFSESKSGEYIADVPVVILNSSGEPVFELPRAGPMLDVMLPAGKYRVSARFKGLTETQSVTLDGTHGRDLAFHWN
jgi:hypothetical protein